MVGVQESCMKSNVTREQQKFVAFTSGANWRGQLGVEAWVHRSVLAQARVRPEPCSSRLLVLKIDGKNINVTVIEHLSGVIRGKQLTLSLTPDRWPCSLTQVGECGRQRANSLGAAPNDTEKNEWERAAKSS